MALSYRIIYWIPTAIFFFLNMLFKLLIFLLQQIGSASVWCNKQIIKAGNYFTDKAQNDDGVDKFIDKLRLATAQTKARRKRR